MNTPNTTIVRRWLAAALLPALLTVAERARCADQAAPPEARVYEDGPLGAADYGVDVPEGERKLDAFTTTELRYKYQYQTRAASRRATAWITQIEVEAIVIPAESWNAALHDAQLMDHEQGHFDITQMGALRARLHFARAPRLSATGTSPELAVARLTELLRQEMEKAEDVVLAEHRAYDRSTSHGVQRHVQAEQRRQHREQLEALSRELAELEPTGRPRSNSAAAR